MQLSDRSMRSSGSSPSALRPPMQPALIHELTAGGGCSLAARLMRRGLSAGDNAAGGGSGLSGDAMEQDGSSAAAADAATATADTSPLTSLQSPTHPKHPPTTPKGPTYVEALLSVVSALLPHPPGLQALTEGGLVPALLQIIKNDSAVDRERAVLKALRMLEGLADLK